MERLAARLAETHRQIAAPDLDVAKLGGSVGGELRRRLRLMLPVLAAGLAGEPVAGLRVPGAKRNAASRVFNAEAEDIACASQRELSRRQRAGGAAPRGSQVRRPAWTTTWARLASPSTRALTLLALQAAARSVLTALWSHDES